MRISSAWLAVESTSDKLFGYCRPYFRFHGRVMLLNVELQTNVDPTLGPVMYVVTFEFSYGGRVNGRGKNYKLGCDVHLRVLQASHQLCKHIETFCVVHLS